jgi:hypothetical protein
MECPVESFIRGHSPWKKKQFDVKGVRETQQEFPFSAPKTYAILTPIAVRVNVKQFSSPALVFLSWVVVETSALRPLTRLWAKGR